MYINLVSQALGIKCTGWDDTKNGENMLNSLSNKLNISYFPRLARRMIYILPLSLVLRI